MLILLLTDYPNLQGEKFHENIIYKACCDLIA